MKQVIVVNEALGLPPGKMAAQVAHASIGAFLKGQKDNRGRWFETGMPKVVLRCGSEADLLAILARAEAAGLSNLLIRDAGRTVVERGPRPAWGSASTRRPTSTRSPAS